MKISKKVLSVLLAVLLLVSVMAVAAVHADAVEVGDTIQFGTYPQTLIESTDALEAAVSNATWKSYGYFSGTGLCDGLMKPGDWMQFADFFCDGVKYRAVKFIQYRPYWSGSILENQDSFQKVRNYSLDTTYFFRYEPLTWRVLDPSAGLIVCDRVIDTQTYQNMTWYNQNDDHYYQGIDSTVYCNDYATSDLRGWLNYDFYETAFTEDQKAVIQTTALNNDAYSPDCAQYNSVGTNDNIFSLSYSDICNEAYGFSTSSDRIAQGTEYAKYQGLEVISDGSAAWWLRSSSDSSRKVRIAGSQSATYNDDTADTACIGVRPACCLSDLTSDGSVSSYLFSAGCTVCTVTATSETGGTVTGGRTYLEGEAATLTATPNSGYHFVGWFNGDSKVNDNASYSFTVTSNVTLNAKFSPHFYTSAITTEPGCETPGVRTYTCDCGDTYTEAIPALGHTDEANDGYCDRCGQMMVGDGYCPQCGKIHNEPLIGWLIALFHRIIYRLTHLFQPAA